MESKIRKQVCSLELSKKLNELGVKQESLFYWKLKKLSGREKYELDYWPSCPPPQMQPISAFTVAELGEILGKESNAVMFNGKTWGVGLLLEPILNFEETTEADARARMLIFLLENNIIDI